MIYLRKWKIFELGDKKVGGKWTTDSPWICHCSFLPQSCSNAFQCQYKCLGQCKRDFSYILFSSYREERKLTGGNVKMIKMLHSCLSYCSKCWCYQGKKMQSAFTFCMETAHTRESAKIRAAGHLSNPGYEPATYSKILLFCIYIYFRIYICLHIYLVWFPWVLCPVLDLSI